MPSKNLKNSSRRNKRRTSGPGGRNGLYSVPLHTSKAATFGREDPYQHALTRIPLFPQIVMQRRQLYYDYQGQLTLPGAGIATQWFYSANSAFDPDSSGTGHQPIGYDVMSSLYEHYCVVRSSITVTFYPLSTPIRCGIYLSPDVVVIADPSEIMENGLVKTLSNDAYGTTTVGNTINSVTLDCDVRKYFGRRDFQQMLNDNSLSAGVGSSPSEQVYFAITGWDAFYSAASTIQLNFDVLISYDVVYFEQKKSSPSLLRAKAPLADERKS